MSPRPRLLLRHKSPILFREMMNRAVSPRLGGRAVVNDPERGKRFVSSDESEAIVQELVLTFDLSPRPSQHNEKLRRDAFKTQLALLVRQIPGMGHHSETRKSVLICTREYIQQLQMREKRLRSQLMSHHLRERALTVALISRGVRPEDVAEEFSIGGIGPTELAQLDEAVEGLIDESAFPRPSSRGPPPHSGFNNEQQGGYPLIQSAAEFYAEPAWESSAPRSVARPMVTRPLAPLHRSSNGYPVLDNYQSQQSMGPAGYPPLPVSGHSASRRGFPVSDGIGFEVGGGYEAPMVTNGRRNEWRSGGW